MSSTPRKKILSDHKQQGKKFFPPAALYGWTEIQYVERILPEIAWIGCLTTLLGLQRGLQCASSLIEACYANSAQSFKSEFSLLTGLRDVQIAEWQGVRQMLNTNGLLKEIQTSLTPFVRCYPVDNPLVHLLNQANIPVPSSADIEFMRSVVSNVFDRRSKDASIVQAVIFSTDIKIGKFQVPSDYPYQNCTPLLEDFDSDFSKDVAAHVRMHVNSTFQFHEGQIGDSWAKYFWNQGLKLTPLQTNNKPLADPDEELFPPIIKLGRDFERYAWEIVDAIWAQFPADIYSSEFSEVVGALLARQCNLVVKVAKNPDMWDYHVGPLFLRPMTDCYITLAWIFKDPVDRARKFILHGLGQEKQEIERLKSVLDDQEGDERARLQKRIDSQEAWLNSQHYAFLQYVDIGSWSGISTRKMAEQADCLDLYGFAYTGWSHAAHGTWKHIARCDAFPTPEPLHKYIWQPARMEHGPQLDVVQQATKYFDKMCVLLVEDLKLNMDLPPPSSWLHDRLDKLAAEVRESEGEDGTTS